METCVRSTGMKTIVISAVNIRKGGTLTILRDCLSYLSSLPAEEYRVVALVHRKELTLYPGIEYIEFPKSINSWCRRLWCEYVSMHRVSRQLAPVDLWLSLHDTTPRVMARRQAVYCQTSFPFLKLKWQDVIYDYKIVLFALFTRFAYKVNVQRNSYLVVQAQWLREGFSRMLSLPEERFVVFPPNESQQAIQNLSSLNEEYVFLYPATPDAHKNFEILCEATRQLEKRVGKKHFCVVITIDGTENKYARSLKREYEDVDSLKMVGFLSKAQLHEYYAKANCLVFPSRIETWGLPISEYGSYNKPMLLSDLPYAHETAEGCHHVGFFNPEDVESLVLQMESLVNGDYGNLKMIPPRDAKAPHVDTWKALFELLLKG